MGHRRHGFDVEDVVLGVGDRFTEERLGVGPHRSPPGGGVIGIVHEGHRDAQLGQGVMEQLHELFGVDLDRKMSCEYTRDWH
jgi:hypothetical protein